MYTKGKWEIRNVGTGRIKITADVSGYGPRPTTTRQVQIASVDNLDIETQLANARLIAAAPQLLEACKKIKKACYDLDHKDIPAPLFNLIENQLTSAIAAAEGGK